MKCEKCKVEMTKIKDIYIPIERTGADFGLPTHYETISFFQCPTCKSLKIV